MDDLVYSIFTCNLLFAMVFLFQWLLMTDKKGRIGKVITSHKDEDDTLEMETYEYMTGRYHWKWITALTLAANFIAMLVYSMNDATVRLLMCERAYGIYGGLQLGILIGMVLFFDVARRRLIRKYVLKEIPKEAEE